MNWTGSAGVQLAQVAPDLVLDVLPDDPRHLIAVQLDDGVLDLDLLEGSHSALVDGGLKRARGDR